MVPLTVDSFGVSSALPSHQDNKRKRVSHENSDGDDLSKSTKIFKQAIDALEKKAEKSTASTENTTKNLEGRAEKNNEADLTERDFMVREIMRDKSVSEDVAQAEYDFFFG